MFGIEPIKDSILPSTESLEFLIEKLNKEGKFEAIVIGNDNPYIQIKEDGKIDKVFLNDTPRLRQLYFNYNCFRSTTVRLNSLNFALKYIKSRKVSYKFLSCNNLREIDIKNTKMIFVYEYCLSEAFLLKLSPVPLIHSLFSFSLRFRAFFAIFAPIGFWNKCLSAYNTVF